MYENAFRIFILRISSRSRGHKEWHPDHAIPLHRSRIRLNPGAVAGAVNIKLPYGESRKNSSMSAIAR